MCFVSRFLLILALSADIAATASADEFPEPYNSERDTSAAPLAASQAAAAFDVPEGFEVTVFAAEPQVRNPLAMAWDSRGRMWVAENYTYAERPLRFDLSLRDRVLILEDTNGDGTADSRKVFTDRLQVLGGLEVGYGGVWLMCPPQLLFIPDADGDDVPDGPAQVVLDGFELAQENHHTFANGLRFGPDGWLYGRCGASSPAKIGRPGTPDDRRFSLEGGIWRYHPETGRAETLTAGTTNPWGHDWNEVGEMFFVNTVNGHLWHMIPGAHFDRNNTRDPNPYTYQLLDMHADHWHFDRGKSWTASRDGAADQFGGGHAHCGAMIYLADQWPAEYRGRLLTLNLHGRRANQEILERDGSGYIARHAPDMLISNDPFFRGLDIRCGPDGSAYVLDWSDTGECHESTGVHRSSGRIYKVTYRGDGKPSKTNEPFDLRSVSDDELLKRLGHVNQWHVRGARMVLQERAASKRLSTTVVETLRADVEEKGDTSAVEAMMTLLAIGGLDREFAFKQLDHAHESVRVWAIRGLTNDWPLDDCYGPVATVETVDRRVLEKFSQMASGDSSGLVRLTLASTLQRLPLDNRVPLAIDLMSRNEDAEDHNLPLMVWYGLMPLGESHPEALADAAVAARWPLVQQLICRRLAERIDVRAEPLERVLAAALRSDDPAMLRAVLTGIADGLKGWRQSPPPEGWNDFASRAAKMLGDDATESLGELAAIFGDGRDPESVAATVLDEKEDVDLRRSALMTLVNQQPDNLTELCSKVLGNRHLNLIAARGLAKDPSPEAAQILVDAYGKFPGRHRPAVIAMLTSRVSFARVLLDAIEKGKIPRGDVTAYDARAIGSLGDESLAERLGEVWGEIRRTPDDRRLAMEQLKTMLTASDAPPADLAAGRLIFDDLCGKCHRLYGEGGTIGPDITGSQRSNLDYLIENILDPSAVVDKDYRVSLLMMADGRVLNGVIVAKTERTLRLQTQTDLLVIDRDDVEEIKLTAQSPMPEGQLDALSEQQIRNLFAYLMHPVQVPRPAEAKQGSESQ